MLFLLKPTNLCGHDFDHLQSKEGIEKVHDVGEMYSTIQDLQ